MLDSYSSIPDRMLMENIGMVLEYIKQHTPEKDPFWHDGETAPLYGVEEKIPVFLTEYTGEKVMDMMEELQHWWNKQYPDLIREMNFFRKILADSLTADCHGIHISPACCLREKLSPEEQKFCRKNSIFNRKLNIEEAEKILEKLELEKRCQEQKYLHMCIELREYLQG